MSRREELEEELAIAQKQLDDAPTDTPEAVLKAYREEYDSVAFALNNLYDDPETETE
ncbi:MAG: hypothetical protein LBM20_00625 [Rikenellaceae bacterium]|jgi:hypothetical protein|nr:hypothetical protein [Rikenellaceae bacterium]